MGGQEVAADAVERDVNDGSEATSPDGTRTRLTFTPEGEAYSAWMPDGRRSS